MKIRPSQLPRVRSCPGSAALCAQVEPRPRGEHAERGSRLHSALGSMLRCAIAGGGGAEAVGMARQAVGSTSDWQALLWCWSIATELLSEEHSVTEVEYQLEMGGLHELIPGGTADLVQATPFMCGRVVDWKFGRREVSARSYQLAAYAVAAADRWGLEKVEVVLAQPVREKVERVFLDSEQLEECRHQIKLVCDRAAAPSGLLVTGPHCRYCDAISTCPAVLDVVGHVDAEQVPEMHAVGSKSLARMLDRAEVVKSWAGAVQQQAHSRLAAGEYVPGWQIKENKRRKWGDGTTVEQLATELAQHEPQITADDLLKQREMLSPAQVEKLTGKRRAIREVMERHIDYTTSQRLVREE